MLLLVMFLVVFEHADFIAQNWIALCRGLTLDRALVFQFLYSACSWNHCLSACFISETSELI